jgi:transposase
MSNASYDETFKKQAVKYVKESGRSAAGVARELGVKDNTLYNWIKIYGDDPDVTNVQSFKSEDHKMKELQRQIKELQEENDILKKAMHFFAKDRR